MPGENIIILMCSLSYLSIVERDMSRQKIADLIHMLIFCKKDFRNFSILVFLCGYSLKLYGI
jgi:hypothetical protein